MVYIRIARSYEPLPTRSVMSVSLKVTPCDVQYAFIMRAGSDDSGNLCSAAAAHQPASPFTVLRP